MKEQRTKSEMTVYIIRRIIQTQYPAMERMFTVDKRKKSESFGFYASTDDSDVTIKECFSDRPLERLTNHIPIKKLY